MDRLVRRKHLQASVAAAAVYGIAVGLWLGARAGDAGWLESCAFAAFLMFAPAISMSRIDARFGYSD